jgi:hypothetical protein
MARLIRITQGKRSLTLRKWSLALEHHVGIIAGKSSNSSKCPSLWNIVLSKTIVVSQHSLGYHKEASNTLRFVIFRTLSLGGQRADLRQTRSDGRRSGFRGRLGYRM